MNSNRVVVYLSGSRPGQTRLCPLETDTISFLLKLTLFLLFEDGVTADWEPMGLSAWCHSFLPAGSNSALPDCSIAGT